MYREVIPIDVALSMESVGIITILDPSDVSGRSEWVSAYKALRVRHNQTKTENLLSFLKTRYLIEIPLEDKLSTDAGTMSWGYVYGFENSRGNNSEDGVEYVYVLINPGYPDLVKIGTTTKTVDKRVKIINATSTVHEWVPRFALPVQKGSAAKIEQTCHKVLENVRVNSDQGNEREFFRINALLVFDKIREIGSSYQIGEVIVY